MADEPTTQAVAAGQSGPYMDRVLPWGEVCRAAESRLKKMGLREAWRQLARQKRMDGQDIHDAHFDALVTFREALESGEPELSQDDAAFVEKAREGLMMALPKRAGVEKELDWIGANLNRSYPNVQDCPSLYCINFIIDARTDEAIRRTFWATCWSKRLSPGDTRAKRTGLKEDVEAEAESDGAAHDAELRRRMFGV